MPVAFVQGNAGSNAGGTSLAVAFAANNAAGNFIIVSSGWGSTTITASISDSAGNTYQTYVGHPVTDAGGGRRGQVWFAENCLAGANTVTVTCSAAVGKNVEIHEYSGVATSASFDVVANATGGPSTTADSGNATTAQNNELLFGFCFTGPVTFTAGTNYTLRQTTARGASEDRLLNTAGANNATMTISVSSNWGMIMVAHKPLGAVANIYTLMQMGVGQ